MMRYTMIQNMYVNVNCILYIIYLIIYHTNKNVEYLLNIL